MKIEIQNWGPIQKCEYDLNKSLIVTYGENNIGKSYAMQVMYLLLKKMRDYADTLGFMRRFYLEIDEHRDIIENSVKDFVVDEKVSVKDITQEIVYSYVKSLEKTLFVEFKTSLKNTFGTYDKILEQNPIITLYPDEDTKYDFILCENKMDVQVEIKKVLLRKTTSDFHKSRNNKEHYDIYVYENHIDTPVRLIRERVYEMQVDFARNIQRWMSDVYFLPASRSGIYTGMSSFGPIMAQLSQNRAYFNRSIQIPSIPEPISDYYMALSSIRLDRNVRFGDLAQEIEQTILNGEVKFDSRQKSLTYYGKSSEQALEMNDVSSMVSEISPIVAYLKYIVKGGNSRTRQIDIVKKNAVSIIFIEEPEAHLHPLNQIKLMKIFTKLSKANIKLVMASHSNYIFNELNNRVLAGELEQETYSPVLMKWEDGRSNTYCMDMDELGVNDSNFADASKLIYDEREELVLRLMERLENENK